MKYNGAGGFKPDDNVRHVRSWERRGRDEFKSFERDTPALTLALTSDACGSGTRALARAMFWKDSGAQFTCIAFLRKRDEDSGERGEGSSEGDEDR